jgi:hypothetical protein
MQPSDEALDEGLLLGRTGRDVVPIRPCAPATSAVLPYWWSRYQNACGRAAAAHASHSNGSYRSRLS